MSIKLKLHTSPEQFQMLRTTQLAYRDALNHVSTYAFEHGKISSNIKLHQGCYPELRSRYHLGAQMACSVEREVAATYKGLWTKWAKNVEHRKAGYTKKRFKGLDKPPQFVSPTLTYHLGHDYSLKPGQQVSILTLRGRVLLSYTGKSSHIALLQRCAEIGAAKLWYDKPRKQYYLLVSLTIERADQQPEDYKQVVGVDVGLRYLAVTSDYKGTPAFYPGTRVRARANHYARLRKRLQRKGTRSAKRRLVTISRRERRLKAQANHEIARRIIDSHPSALIGLEDLSNIRERTKRRKWRRKKNGKGSEPVSTKQRKANRVYSQWSFAELQSMISYKAMLAGSIAIKVDAAYTSKACPRCGYVSDENRLHRGLLFCCVSCHYTLHADLVGARNLTMRTLLVRQDWARTGALSVRPDVSDREAKAERLYRYSELRWSLDTSSSLSSD